MCKYCETKTGSFECISDVVSTFARFWFGTNEDKENFTPVYCPFCGRKLNNNENNEEDNEEDSTSYLVVDMGDNVLGCYDTVDEVYDAVADDLVGNMEEDGAYELYTVTAYKKLNVEIERKLKIK